MDGVNEVTVDEMERLICQLPTVLKCAVSVNDWGAIEEVHVLTSLERTPKQVVRDVESALLAQWNLRIDHKRISVAQIVTGDEDGAKSRESAPMRLRIHEYHMDADALQQQAYTRVVYSWGESAHQRVTGEWSGRYLPSQYYQAMAWAAVEAVNQLPGLETPMVLAELRTISVANRTVILVALSQYDRRRRETLLIGTAEERGDGQGASVRAVLDAVNRKVSRIPLQAGGLS
ncbi:MAG: hypothetical protein M1272_01505 [Firmicutes bacterium]|nr:hypothetical protein [Bacillota bacterium]